ncbi:hypothetical protein NKH71_32885 [Mesorhizobium sp. M0983]|uniref:hypothetical protein n=1 Tax=Mesorhizobium sp. M0983 TaxID=2957040 RepID=UPI0033374D4A
MVTQIENTAAVDLQVAEPSKDDARGKRDMVKTVACVLRSGGEFEPHHVVRLFNQVTEHLPGAKFRCFSDVDVQGVEVIPLRYESIADGRRMPSTIAPPETSNDAFAAHKTVSPDEIWLPAVCGGSGKQ